MTKISRRESRSKGKDCSTLPHSESSQTIFIPLDILIYQISHVKVTQRKQKSKGISVADVYLVTKHMNFTLKEMDISLLLGTDGFFPLLQWIYLLSYRKTETKWLRWHSLQRWYERYLKLCKPPGNRQNALCCHTAV